MTRDQEEFQDYLEASFEPFQTADQSFSLRPIQTDQEQEVEAMHSKAGAVSESFYIYHQALELFAKKAQDDKYTDLLLIESVGLGLGYNEVLAMLALSQSNLTLNCQIVSYETEKSLVELFLKRLEQPQRYPVYWKAFKSRVDFDEQKLSNLLLKTLSFRGALSIEQCFQFERKAILFDAYSNQTTQDLWRADFLNSYLSKTKKGSVFATYAATGNLNRALKKNEFENQKKSGFSGKRQSTLALKTH